MCPLTYLSGWFGVLRVAGMERRHGLQRDDKRPSTGISMNLLSLHKGAVHGYATNTLGRIDPWNKGKLLGQTPLLKLKEIWPIRIRLQLDRRTRELACSTSL
jgi:hypothetical protein